MKLPALLALAASVVLASTAAASIDIKTYKELRKQTELPPEAHEYILGVGDGFAVMNSALTRANQKPLYCQPALALNGDNLLSLIDKSIERHSKSAENWTGETDIGVVLLEALKSTFPCG